jgi:hypothetical protein
MVRSGGIEWLIFKYIYNIKMYLQMKMLALNCKSCLQNSMLWRSIISIKLVFYIITVVYWNIGCTESCMYKSVFRKINKLQKKIQWPHFVPFLHFIGTAFSSMTTLVLILHELQEIFLSITTQKLWCSLLLLHT